MNVSGKSSYRLACGLLAVLMLFGTMATATAAAQPAAIDCAAHTQLDAPAMPILVVTDSGFTANPFGCYLTEILRAEGLLEFQHADLPVLVADTDPGGYLESFDLVLLAETSLGAGEEQLFRDFVAGGGSLVAMRPDVDLDDLFGLAFSGTRSEQLLQYFAVDTGAAPGAGIEDLSLQYHGEADNYALAGAVAAASLYDAISTPSANPAVALSASGAGRTAAFAFDLARSVVLTRQGNPAWQDSEGDGLGSYRPMDMFWRSSSVSYLSVPRLPVAQADEAQRLLANVILSMASHPLPRMWYLPGTHKRLVVNTGDGEGGSGSSLAPPMNAVAARGGFFTHYFREPGINGTSVAQEAGWRVAGHETGVHMYGGGQQDFTTLFNSYQSITGSLQSKFGHGSRTCRNHTIDWVGWSEMAEIEAQFGTGLDTNYYHYPNWLGGLNNGYFTGSGLAQRFSDENGVLLGIYQAATQWPDEWFADKGLSVTQAFNAVTGMLEAAETEGYYSAFVNNIHPVRYNGGDITSGWADQLWDYCQANGIPLWSAEMLLDFMEARNTSTFDAIAWGAGTLTFDYSTPTADQDLTIMVPNQAATGQLSGITLDGSPHPFTTETIKGIDYALFDADTGSYVVSYLVPGDTDGDGFAPPADCNDSDDTIFPGAPELCDGVDSDCDGQLDEDFPDLGNACSAGVGECNSPGVRVCSGNGLTTECNAVPGTPVAELCDGLDNDCDGSSDEIFGDLGQACSVGVGECAAAGVKVCAAGGGGTECDAVPGAPTTEVCNGLDDDCDGSTDEGTSGGSCSTGQLGACAAGTEQCISGVLNCIRNTPPAAETCNGVDDDCDGSTDEGDPGGGGSCSTGLPGVCASGVFQCQGGALQCIGSPASSEICDGLDNDCDGSTDEGTGGGACGTGQPGCPSGIEVCQSGSLVCDADGQPCDDGDACTQTDACDGTAQCVGTDPVTCAGPTDCASAETCNTGTGQCDAGTPLSAGTPCTADADICTDDECDGAGTCDHIFDASNDLSCVVVTTTVTTSTTATTGPPSTTTTTLVEALCAAQPRTSGCFASGRASLQLKDNSDDGRDQLKWKWTRGDATAQADMGDPLSTSTYALCIYDSTAATPTLVASVEIGPNAAWTEKDPKGWKYKDKLGAFDGVQKAQLKTGAAGKSKAQVKAKGASIPMPAPLGVEYFDADPSVVAQLVNDEGRCWTSEFTSATRNEADQYKAKGP